MFHRAVELIIKKKKKVKHLFVAVTSDTAVRCRVSERSILDF